MGAVLNNDWDALLKDEFLQEYYLGLRERLISEYKTQTVYPGMHDIFNALALTPYGDVKVVILGQDPYHNEGQAHGLSFSVREETRIPPSLVNIFKELNDDLAIPKPPSGDLSAWAREGVLLLNSVLTVRAHQPASHKDLGWEKFTDRIISLLNDREKPVVFILWGAFAISKGKLVTNARHLVLSSAHPSPMSASKGFFGSRPFSRANGFLSACGIGEVNWGAISDRSPASSSSAQGIEA